MNPLKEKKYQTEGTSQRGTWTSRNEINIKEFFYFSKLHPAAPVTKLSRVSNTLCVQLNRYSVRILKRRENRFGNKGQTPPLTMDNEDRRVWMKFARYRINWQFARQSVNWGIREPRKRSRTWFKRLSAFLAASVSRVPRVGMEIKPSVSMHEETILLSLWIKRCAF